MRTCCFKVLVAWCVLTVLFSPVALHVPCPIALVMLAIKINTALGACVASLLILVYLPRAFSAPTASEMRIKVQQLEVAEKDLRHANRELQQQLLYRGVLERELSIMRTLQFAKNQQEIDKAVNTLDSICAELRSLMPEKYRDAPVPSNGPFPSASAQSDGEESYSATH